MKKIALLLSVVMVLALASCSSKEETIQKDISLEAVYQNIMDAQTVEMPAMSPESSVELIESFYPGLFDAGVEEEILYTPSFTGSPCEIMLVKAKNKDDIPAIIEILQARINLGKADTLYPANAQAWQGADIQSAEQYAAMIVLPEGGVIPENIFILESDS